MERHRGRESDEEVEGKSEREKGVEKCRQNETDRGNKRIDG